MRFNLHKPQYFANRNIQNYTPADFNVEAKYNKLKVVFLIPYAVILCFGMVSASTRPYGLVQAETTLNTNYSMRN